MTPRVPTPPPKNPNEPWRKLLTRLLTQGKLVRTTIVSRKSLQRWLPRIPLTPRMLPINRTLGRRDVEARDLASEPPLQRSKKRWRNPRRRLNQLPSPRLTAGARDVSLRPVKSTRTRSPAKRFDRAIDLKSAVARANGILPLPRTRKVAVDHHLVVDATTANHPQST